MQWNEATHAGFTIAEPWLPVADNFRTTNVAVQEEDPASLLALYRALIALRREYPALQIGDYLGRTATEQILAYERRHEEQRILVVLNLTNQAAAFQVGGPSRLLLSTHRQCASLPQTQLRLLANEGVILEMSGDHPLKT